MSPTFASTSVPIWAPAAVAGAGAGLATADDPAAVSTREIEGATGTAVGEPATAVTSSIPSLASIGPRISPGPTGLTGFAAAAGSAAPDTTAGDADPAAAKSAAVSVSPPLEDVPHAERAATPHADRLTRSNLMDL